MNKCLFTADCLLLPANDKTVLVRSVLWDGWQYVYANEPNCQVLIR